MAEIPRPDDLATMVADLHRRVRELETAARLTSASQRGGALRIIDPNTDAEVVRLGDLLDGTYGLNVAAGRITVEGAVVDAVSTAVDFVGVTDVSLNTTPSAKATCTLPVPTWCERALVVGFCTGQLDNSSGGLQLFSLGVRIDEHDNGSMDTLVSNATIEALSAVDAKSISSPGSSISVQAFAHVSVGTNSVNKFRLSAIGMFLRV